MDSLTQAVLGASVAGVCAPKGHRRKALLVGAGLGTVPDLDVLIDFGGVVENFTYHRGFSHSLFVLAPFSVFLWLALKRWWPPVSESPLRWLAAISLTLLTHPLLDAHTAYGTQLFWPMTVPPTMWATLFIIDPLYSLPLLVGVSVAAVRPFGNRSGLALRGGLALSTVYLGWSWTAQAMVENHARESLAALQIQDAPMFITPTPLNTLLWRIVVLDEDSYLEGFDSLLLDEETIQFKRYESDTKSLQEAGEVWAVARLRWFSRDFLKAYVDGNRLVLSDLRMGQEPTYVFNHAVAIRGNPHWMAIEAERLSFSFEDRALTEVWDRIWQDAGRSDAD